MRSKLLKEYSSLLDDICISYPTPRIQRNALPFLASLIVSQEILSLPLTASTPLTGLLGINGIYSAGKILSLFHQVCVWDAFSNCKG